MLPTVCLRESTNHHLFHRASTTCFSAYSSAAQQLCFDAAIDHSFIRELTQNTHVAFAVQFAHDLLLQLVLVDWPLLRRDCRGHLPHAPQLHSTRRAAAGASACCVARTAVGPLFAFPFQAAALHAHNNDVTIAILPYDQLSYGAAAQPLQPANSSAPVRHVGLLVRR